MGTIEQPSQPVTAAPEQLLTSKQAARHLQVTDKTLLRWCQLGKLPFSRLSDKTLRFRQQDIDQFVLDQQVEAQASRSKANCTKLLTLPSERAPVTPETPND